VFVAIDARVNSAAAPWPVCRFSAAYPRAVPATRKSLLSQGHPRPEDSRLRESPHPQNL